MNSISTRFKQHNRKQCGLLDRRSAILLILAVISTIAAFGVLPPREALATYFLYEQSHRIGDNNTIRSDSKNIVHDSQGNFYVTALTGDTSDKWVQKFSADNKLLVQWRPYAGMEPTSMAIDSDDNIWLSFFSIHIIVKYSPNGERLLVVGTPNSPSSINGRFNQPAYLATDASGGIYVSDYKNNRIQKFNTEGLWQWTTGGVAAGSADGQFNEPTFLATDSEGNLFVADRKNNRIQKLSSNGDFILKFGQVNPPGMFCPAHPSLDRIDGMVVDISTDIVYVASQKIWCHNLYKFDGNNGNYLGGPDSRIEPVSMYEGIIYGGSYSDSALSSYDTNGVVISKLTDKNSVGQIRGGFKGLAEDSEGNVYVIDGSDRVFKFDDNGNFISILIDQGTTPELVHTPVSIAIDSDDNLYIADSGRYTVKKFDKNGTYITSFGSQGNNDNQFSAPIRHVVIDSNNDIYIATANTIKRFSADGSLLSTRSLDASINYMFISSVDELNVMYTHWPYTMGKIETRILKISSEGNDIDNLYVDYGRNYGGASIDGNDNIWLYDNQTIGPFDQNSHKLRSHITSSQIFTSDGSGSMLGNVPDNDEGSAPHDRKIFFYISPKTNRMYVSGYFNFIQVMEPTALVDAPSSPQNLTAEADNPSKININWDEPTQTNNDSNVTYTVRYRPHRYGKWITAKMNISDRNFTLANLLDDTYDIQVSAVNSAGEGPPVIDNNIKVVAPYTFKESKVLSQYDGGGLQTGVVDADGTMYTYDSWNTGKIYVQSADGTPLYDFGDWDTFGEILDIIIGPDNKLYMADRANDKVIVANKDGTIERSFGEYGTGPGQLYNPNHISYDKQSDTLLVTNRWRKVQRFTLDGIYIETVASGLSSPSATAVDSKGNIFIANSSGDEEAGIYKYAPDGTTLIAMFARPGTPEEFADILDMVVGIDDNIIASDIWNYRLLTFDNNGNSTGHFGYSYWDSGIDEIDDYMSFGEVSGMSVSLDGTIYLYNNYDSAKYMAISPTGLAIDIPIPPADPDSKPDSKPKPTPNPEKPPAPNTSKPDSSNNRTPSRTATPDNSSSSLHSGLSAAIDPNHADKLSASVAATPDPEKGFIHVAWRKPTDYLPVIYLIEYYDESTNKWRESSSVGGTVLSVSLKLSPGDYRLRVAALTEDGQRHVLGVAAATLTERSQKSDHDAQSKPLDAASLSKEEGISVNTISFCSAIGLLVFTIVLIIIYRRRRNKLST